MCSTRMIPDKAASLSWLSESLALSSGLTITGSPLNGTNSLTPSPSVDANMKAMLQNGKYNWQGTSWGMNQDIANGVYYVYVYMMEDYYTDSSRRTNVSLEGTQVATGIGGLAKNSWQKYGPYAATVSDGVMNISFVGTAHESAVMGVSIFSTSGTPAPGGETFVKGIDLNGTGGTIDGNSWLSQSAATSSGLTITGSPMNGSNSLTPNPSVDATKAAMLRGGIYNWQGTSTGLNQTIANGGYNVYVYMMEDYYTDNSRRVNLTIEGTQVATGIGGMATNTWLKYGPYAVTVNDGVMNISFVGTAHEGSLAGLSILNYYWTDGHTANGTPIKMSFEIDNGWSHTQVNGIQQFTMNESELAGKYYEYDYSRVYYR